MSYDLEKYENADIDAILRSGDRKIREELSYCYSRLAWYEKGRQSVLQMQNECELAQKTMETRWRDLQVELDREHKAARASRAGLLKAQGQLEEYKRHSESETVKARVAERALETEKGRADRLERRVWKLELAVARGKSRRAASGESLLSAIEKLTTRSPVVGKRIAAACHPDKVPSDCSELASELFRLIQSLRDTA